MLGVVNSDQSPIACLWTSITPPPGSKEQLLALGTLGFLIGMWADFLTSEEKRMDQVMTLEAGNS